MTVHVHTQFTVQARRIHPDRTPIGKVMCHRCGIIKTAPGNRRDLTDYWCMDCTPYRKDAA